MSKSISEIRQEFEMADEKNLPFLYQKYAEDTRSGVQKLIEKYQRMEQKREQELARTEKMMSYERKYADYDYICGIDEVGRGPLAGPVVAGAVILPKDCKILYINDSKQLS